MLATAAKNDQQKGIQIKEKESQRNITAKVQRLSTNFTRVVNLFPDRDLERIEHVFITDSPGFESSPFFLTNDYQILFVRSQERLRDLAAGEEEKEKNGSFQFEFQFQDKYFVNITVVKVELTIVDDNSTSCLVSNEHLCSEVSRPGECESSCGEGAKNGGRCQWVQENR